MTRRIGPTHRCSRYKVARALCAGPATGRDVHRLLEAAFETHSAPSVLKRAGGPVFDVNSVRELLDDHIDHGIEDLNENRPRPVLRGMTAIAPKENLDRVRAI